MAEGPDAITARINRIVPLSTSIVSRFLRQLAVSIAGETPGDFSIDISRELRGRSFKVVHLILKNPLQELISTDTARVLESKSDGLLFVFAGPSPNYLNDGIEWTIQRKMSVKLILHDTQKDVYKVKNAKSDEGVVILRRQTWQNETMGWRRHEYKIYQDQVFYRTLPNGQVVSETKSGLADFPVLVHYFKKRPDIPIRQRKKQKRTEFDEEEVDDFGDELTTENDDHYHSNSSSSALTILRSALKSTIASSSTSSVSTAASAATLPLIPDLQRHSHQIMTATPFGSGALASAISMGLRQSVFHPSAPIRLDAFGSDAMDTDQTDPRLTAPSAGLQDSSAMDISLADDPFQANLNVDHFLASTTPPPPQSACIPTYSFAFFGFLQKRLWKSFAFTLNTKFAKTPDAVSVPQESPTLGMELFKSPESSTPTPWGLKISSFAPDNGPALEKTKILLVVETLNTQTASLIQQAFDQQYQPEPQASIVCSFDGMEIECRLISSNVLEVLTPPRQAGISSVWICVHFPKNSPFRTNHSDVPLSMSFAGSPTMSSTVLTPNPVRFAFVPSDIEGKLSLAYQMSPDSPYLDIVQRFRFTCRYLDLSHNQLQNVDFLSSFYQLQTLILDYNRISETTRFPCLRTLETLSLNSNNIVNIQVTSFIEELSASFPRLQYLSTLGNECCPIISSLPHRYYNYRIFIISCIADLTYLDSSSVTDEERRHAESIRPAGEDAQGS